MLGHQYAGCARDVYSHLRLVGPASIPRSASTPDSGLSFSDDGERLPGVDHLPSRLLRRIGMGRRLLAHWQCVHHFSTGLLVCLCRQSGAESRLRVKAVVTLNQNNSDPPIPPSYEEVRSVLRSTFAEESRVNKAKG